MKGDNKKDIKIFIAKSHHKIELGGNEKLPSFFMFNQKEGRKK